MMNSLAVMLLFSLWLVGGDSKPNILLIFADDLGVNDVSWNNPTVVVTPSLGSLARAGTVLEQAYTLPVCSPSRAALLTGTQPYKFGFQVQSLTREDRQN